MPGQGTVWDRHGQAPPNLDFNELENLFQVTLSDSALPYNRARMHACYVLQGASQGIVLTTVGRLA